MRDICVVITPKSFKLTYFKPQCRSTSTERSLLWRGTAARELTSCRKPSSWITRILYGEPLFNSLVGPKVGFLTSPESFKLTLIWSMDKILKYMGPNFVLSKFVLGTWLARRSITDQLIPFSDTCLTTSQRSMLWRIQRVEPPSTMRLPPRAAGATTTK